MTVKKPSALSYNQLWRSTNNRYYWIQTRVNSRPEIWQALDIENGSVHRFYGDTLKDYNNDKNKLTRIYGMMREPSVVPNHLAKGYSQGVDTPQIARINRALLRTFSGKTIKKEEPSLPAQQPVNTTAVQKGRDPEITWGEKRVFPPVGPDLNLSENQIVVVTGGLHMRVVGVYPNNPWKYHVVPMDLPQGVVSTFRADGSDPLTGDQVIDVLLPKIPA